MGFDVSPDRPVVQLVVRGLTGNVRPRIARRGPYVPSLPPTVADAFDDELRSSAVTLSARLLRAMLTGESTADLADWLHPDVVVWSPAVYSLCRDTALANLAGVPSIGDTLSEVSLMTTAIDVVLPHVYLEWRLSGRFSKPCFVDDDLLLEPTGRFVEIAGILVTTIVDGRVASLHCYYDDVALLEQLIIDPLRI